MKRLYLAVITIISVGCVSNLINSSKKNPKHFLTDGKCKFWDASVGYDLLFYEVSSKVIKYSYDKNTGQRKVVDFNDFIIDFFYWDLKFDTLFIRPSLQVYPSKFVVLHLSEDSLVLLDLKKSWGVDTLFYKKSKDQTTFPIKE
jgi:hypothetical protein